MLIPPAETNKGKPKKNFYRTLSLTIIVISALTLVILASAWMNNVTHAQDPALPTPTPVPSGDNQDKSTPIPGPRTSPTITIARYHDSVTEGSWVYFILTASSAPSANLNINVSVTQSGAMLTGTIPSIITIAGGATTAWLILQTNNDTTYETDSNVTASINTGTGYTRSSTKYQDSVLVEDNDEYGPPKNLQLSVEDNDDNDLDLSYTKNKGPRHYYQLQLHRSVTQSGTYITIRTVNDISPPADFDNLAYGYWYKAREETARASTATTAPVGENGPMPSTLPTWPLPPASA